MQLSRKAPLINSISMQTHRRCCFWEIQTEGIHTHTHTHACSHTCMHAQAKQCVLYWTEKRDTLSSYFIWSISFAFLSELCVSHASFLFPSSADECVSVSDRCSGATHTHLSADVTAHCSLCVSASVGDWQCWIVNGRKCCTCSKQSTMNESGEKALGT